MDRVACVALSYPAVRICSAPLTFMTSEHPSAFISWAILQNILAPTAHYSAGQDSPSSLSYSPQECDRYEALMDHIGP